MNKRASLCGKACKAVLYVLACMRIVYAGKRCSGRWWSVVTLLDMHVIDRPLVVNSRCMQQERCRGRLLTFRHICKAPCQCFPGNCHALLAGAPLIQRHLLRVRVASQWGDMSLVDATLLAMEVS